jgi:hypothetical protein
MTCHHIIGELAKSWVAFPKAQGNAKFTLCCAKTLRTP